MDITTLNFFDQDSVWYLIYEIYHCSAPTDVNFIYIQIRLNSGSDDDSKPILKNPLLQHHPNSPILFVTRDQ